MNDAVGGLHISGHHLGIAIDQYSARRIAAYEQEVVLRGDGCAQGAVGAVGQLGGVAFARHVVVFQDLAQQLDLTGIRDSTDVVGIVERRWQLGICVVGRGG